MQCPNNITETGRKLDGNADSVMPTGCCPDLYVSLFLNDYHANYYQNLIGFLRCAVDIRCINIYVEVTLIYCYLDQI